LVQGGAVNRCSVDCATRFSRSEAVKTVTALSPVSRYSLTAENVAVSGSFLKKVYLITAGSAVLISLRQIKPLLNMNSKTQELVSAIIISSLVSTAVNFATPAMAQTVSPRSVLKVGEVFKSGMKRFGGAAVGGAGGVAGTYAANKVLNAAPVPTVFWQHVRMPDGQVYRVCQQVQNGNYGASYWC
jgi:hypothetical protein